MSAHLSCLEIYEYVMIVVDCVRERIGITPSSLEVFATDEAPVDIDVR